ncbi:MAG: WXG100 family type VII secretion target [Chloroflexi bacterium]|nr:WXG100 family type VII secretion target [Chloroflexota bacterium]MBV9898699.1 WXG100 family type VII secretion target [Chloroflexota bacterium]
MADRVLSSGEARSAIQRFQSIVNGPLLDQINALNREGQVLSDPSNWDGRLAQEFRSNWPTTNQQLVKVKDSLEELRRKVAVINQDIMRAGGNA